MLDVPEKKPKNSLPTRISKPWNTTWADAMASASCGRPVLASSSVQVAGNRVSL